MADEPKPQPGPGTPEDAVGAFEGQVVKAANAEPSDTADVNVSVAFSLGWQMAELYRPDLRRRSERLDNDLPGLGSIDDQARIEILVDQVQAAITKLADRISKAGLPAIDIGPVRTSIGSSDLQAKVLAVHRQLLGRLTAVDFRLGKAYGLGRALADTCRKPTGLAGVQKELGEHRIATLRGWLDDLSSAFPAHAAHSVAASLQTWTAWVPKAAEHDPIADTLAALRRQGELWRSLLSGEKKGTELLEIGNYIDAAGELAKRMGAITRRAIWRFKLLSLLIVLLLGGGIALLIIGGGSQDVAGATSLLAAIGLTWKGVGGALGQLAGKLEQPLWGAVLDLSIAEAITMLPNNEGDHGDRLALAVQMAKPPGAAQAPPAGNASVTRSE